MCGLRSWKSDHRLYIDSVYWKAMATNQTTQPEGRLTLMYTLISCVTKGHQELERMKRYSGPGLRAVLDVSNVGAVNVTHSETTNTNKWLVAGWHSRHSHVEEKHENSSLFLHFDVSGLQNTWLYGGEPTVLFRRALILCGGAAAEVCGHCHRPRLAIHILH